MEIPFFVTEGTAQASWPLSLCTHVPYPHGHKSTLAHPERQGPLSTVSEHGRKAERTRTHAQLIAAGSATPQDRPRSQGRAGDSLDEQRRGRRRGVEHAL